MNQIISLAFFIMIITSTATAFCIVKAIFKGGLKSYMQSVKYFLTKNSYVFIFLIFYAILFPIYFYNHCTNYVPDGYYCYKVNVIASNGTEYVLPAAVRRGDPYNEGAQQWYINRFYWPNGGYCDFESVVDNDIYTDKYVNLKNHADDRDYDIKLTNMRTTHPKITEQAEQRPWLDDFLMTLTIFTAFFMLYCKFKRTQ